MGAVVVNRGVSGHTIFCDESYEMFVGDLSTPCNATEESPSGWGLRKSGR